MTQFVANRSVFDLPSELAEKLDAAYEAADTVDDRMDMSAKKKKVDMDYEEDGEYEDGDYDRDDSYYEDSDNSLDGLKELFDSLGTTSFREILSHIDSLEGELAMAQKLIGTDVHNDSEGLDLEGLEALLERLDADTPAEALLKMDHENFVAEYGEVLPPSYSMDGKTPHDARVACLRHYDKDLGINWDSEEAVDAAFSLWAKQYADTRKDNTTVLTNTLYGRNDMAHASLPPGHNKSTNTPIRQSLDKKRSASVWNVSQGDM